MRGQRRIAGLKWELYKELQLLTEEELSEDDWELLNVLSYDGEAQSLLAMDYAQKESNAQTDNQG